MIYAQIEAYYRQRASYSIADQWGSMVAHHDLLQAALRYSSVSGAHLFCEPSDVEKQRRDPALLELEAEFSPGRVSCFPVTDLISRSEETEYIFVTGVSGLYQLSQIRRQMRRKAFPVCGILHTISWPFATFSYLTAFSFCQPYDSLVVTSQAGLKALKELLDEAFSFLSWRFKRQWRPQIVLEHIPLGVEPEFLRPIDKAEARRLFGLPEDCVVILYLGRLTDEYKADLESLLISFSRAAAERRSLRLMIAGGDDGRNYPARLREVAQSLGIGDRISFITDFQIFAKPVILSAADIFVSPVDNIQETFGIAILEAMAAGLPVIASDWSGYRDLVADGESGFLIPTLWESEAADRISQVMALCDQFAAEHYLAQRTPIDIDALTARLILLSDNPELRQRLGERGRRRLCEKFSWPVVMRRYDELWQRQWQALSRSEDPSPSLRLNINDIYRSFASR
jgi:glycosyltransferase involved in cell wall biosynthesis